MNVTKKAQTSHSGTCSAILSTPSRNVNDASATAPARAGISSCRPGPLARHQRRVSTPASTIWLPMISTRWTVSTLSATAASDEIWNRFAGTPGSSAGRNAIHTSSSGKYAKTAGKRIQRSRREVSRPSGNSSRSTTNNRIVASFRRIPTVMPRAVPVPSSRAAIPRNEPNRIITAPTRLSGCRDHAISPQPMNDSEISRLRTSSTGDGTPWTISVADAQMRPARASSGQPQRARVKAAAVTRHSFRSQSPRPRLLAGQHDVERGA